MNLSRLLPLIKELPGYHQLVKQLGTVKSEHGLVTLNAAKPYLIAALYEQLALPTIVITGQAEDSRKFHDQLQVWCSTSSPAQLFPEPAIMPYEYAAANSSSQLERLRVLATLSFSQIPASNGNKPPLVVTSALAAISKTIPPTDFAAACHNLKLKMTIDPLQLIAKWQSIGYELEDIVEVPGTISRRGGIIDIFSPHSELPARLEFFGNQIESIRLFDPKTQRSLKLVPSITVTPARESPILEINDRAKLNQIINAGSILDYLPPNALLVTDDPNKIATIVNKLDGQATERLRTKLEQEELPSDFPLPHFTRAQLRSKIKEAEHRLTLWSWDANDANKTPRQALPFAPAPSYGGRLEIFLKAVRQMLKESYRVIVVSHQANRLSELLQEQDILVSPVSQIEEVPPPGSVSLVQGSLVQGWIIKGNLSLITDAEIFGFIKQQRSATKRPVRHQWLLPQLSPGDYVVHIEHGIGKFNGLTKLSPEGIEREYLIIEYAAGDRLYVPADQIDRVSRYTGGGEQPPTLNRLGTQEWARIKQRVKESVANIAQELLALYALREVIPGFAFSPDTIWQQELEAAFPYIETPDQLEAAQVVKEDMEKPKPMDRLICGDVGYGKTEVALRAAFKAIMGNKQVALLVPTTVLAQQHFTTFRERLQVFPIRVEMLSRFCSAKEQRAILRGLTEGTVDVCIGTHRLLQKDVAFKSLGLIIIDEEQRFGVVHKEQLKKVRREVDVLTLSATPIPRTLHISLAGIRDMSVMETPPEERLPIKTYVGSYNDELVRQAILAELERNGQVFFVHNRVQSIALVADKLQRLVPEARITTAHGQMPGEKLERVMADFIAGKSDVLITTTIIESGLDMPNVNTLIVNQADKLGLTQLYQLRGRIGRGTNRAYAYFLFDKGKHLTLQAQKRLRTIFEATDLGAGFGIALKDLEIRGAGNLLGAEQSGHIATIGFDLYCQLLAEAVEELKAKQTGEVKPKMAQPPPPSIALPLAAYIPQEYVPNLETRLGLYRRLAKVNRVEQITDIARELSDRFEELPLPVKNLLHIVEIKLLAAGSGVRSISKEGKQIVLNFNEGKKMGKLPGREDYKDAVKIGTTQIRISTTQLENKWLELLEKILRDLSLTAQPSE